MKDRSLNFYLSLSWIIPSVCAGCASLIVFATFGWLDFQNTSSRIASELEQKSVKASRRLAAEVLLISGGETEAVAEQLRKNMGLKSLTVVDHTPCNDDAKQTCLKPDLGFIQMFVRIPHVEEKKYVRALTDVPPLSSHFRPGILLWSVLPIFFILVFGLWLQRILIKKYVVSPIHSLVDAAERSVSPSSFWPKEIKKIASDLAKSFQGRERAVFAMLAKGVIHDVKTLLHSMGAASELVAEQEMGSEKRNRRLENLQTACARNIKKANKIIEETLDGSRDIPIKPKEGDIAKVIDGAISINNTLAKNGGVEINFSHVGRSMIVAHDPVQLERAIANLVKNGVEATIEKDGHKLVDVSLHQRARSVEILIEDSGPGFDYQSSDLFEPKPSKKVHGSGLGLYIARKIVEGHKGLLSAAPSTRLQGACFKLVLPQNAATGEI